MFQNLSAWKSLKFFIWKMVNICDFVRTEHNSLIHETQFDIVKELTHY